LAFSAPLQGLGFYPAGGPRAASAGGGLALGYRSAPLQGWGGGVASPWQMVAELALPAEDEMAVDQGPVRFSVRGLLLMLTTACGVLGILQWMLPSDLPTGMRMWISAGLLLGMAYAFWIYYQSRRQIWQAPVDFVTVKVDAKWLRRIKSPYIMWPIAALTGVSLTFAPFYLFWCGPVEDLGVWEWLGVAASFLMIYLVPGFYMRLAAEVMAELMREDRAEADGGAERAISAPGSAEG
jgi:hypothetical protein